MFAAFLHTRVYVYIPTITINGAAQLSVYSVLACGCIFFLHCMDFKPCTTFI